MAKKGKNAASAVEEQEITEEIIFTVDDLKGLSVSLQDEQAYWRLESGKIELNRLTGEVSAQIPQDLSEYDKACVVAGLNRRRIIPAEKVEKERPGVRDISSMMTVRHIEARRILDEKDEDFNRIMEKVHGSSLLDAMLEVETNEGGREERIKRIRKQLSIVENLKK